MDEGIKRLREIGAQKIYEQTHISRANIEAILDQTFTGMMPVQVSGFISILEREYGVDLSRLKESYSADANKLAIKISVKVDSSDTELSEPHLEEEQRSWKWLIALLLVAVVFAVMMMTGGEDEERLHPTDVEQAVAQQSPTDASLDTTLEDSDAKMSPALEQMSDETADLNSSVVASSEETETAVEPVKATTYLTIVPRARLWMGIIDLSNRKRSVEITKDPVELNASKPWLLVFGHGHFNIENGEQELKFKRQGKIRLLFEDGLVSEIDAEEYKARNGGRNW